MDPASSSTFFNLGPNQCDEDDLLRDDSSFTLLPDSSHDDPTVKLASQPAEGGRDSTPHNSSGPVLSSLTTELEQAKTMQGFHHTATTLRRERDWLAGLNKMLEQAADDLDTVKEKMLRVDATTAVTHELLDLYSRILTQTEHTQQLILDPKWKGASRDATEAAEVHAQELAEAESRAQAAREEQERREAAAARKVAALQVDASASATAPVANALRGGRQGTRGKGAAAAGPRDVPSSASVRDRGSTIRSGLPGRSRIGRVRGRGRGTLN